MRPRIAIPVPHSGKPDYNLRSLPQYVHAVEASGGEAVVIREDLSNAEVAKLAATCHGVLLPGSPADVDPQKFNQPRHAATSDPDPKRDNLDELLLQDSFNMRKPVFGICYGLQSLNVWRSGTLVQDIDSQVNHQAGREVPIAHHVNVLRGSRLAHTLNLAGIMEIDLPVNSSHHQAPESVGDGLRAVGRSAEDPVTEALEGTDPGHWVLGVQWHPERGFDQDAASQAIFRDFISAAAAYQPQSRDTESLPAR